MKKSLRKELSKMYKLWYLNLYTRKYFKTADKIPATTENLFILNV